LHRALRRQALIINQQLYLHKFHIKHLKQLKSMRHVSIILDHHQGNILVVAKITL